MTPEAFVLIIHFTGISPVPAWGPFPFTTAKDCKVAAIVAAGLVQSGRVTCETNGGEVIAEWTR